MLSVISPVLLLGVILFTFFKQQWHRLACAIAVSIPTYAHYKYFDPLTGWEYYGSAMGFSILSIALLQIVKPNEKPSQLVVHLQIISLILAIINLTGYAIWYEFHSPVWYNNLVLVFAIVEVLRLILHTNGDKQDGTNGVYYSWIARHNWGRLGGRG